MVLLNPPEAWKTHLIGGEKKKKKMMNNLHLFEHFGRKIAIDKNATASSGFGEKKVYFQMERKNGTDCFRTQKFLQQFISKTTTRTWKTNCVPLVNLAIPPNKENKQTNKRSNDLNQGSPNLVTSTSEFPSQSFTHLQSCCWYWQRGWWGKAT